MCSIILRVILEFCKDYETFKLETIRNDFNRAMA